MGDLIRTTPELTETCTALKTGGVAALDTEFVWSRTYRPRLGIVQMADAAGVCKALDCMTGTDSTPFADVLADSSVVKILHDAHQDLDLIHHYTGACPRNVFDTQLAAGFCDFTSSLGLQKLLMEVLDIGLPKTETLTDWCQRPLTDAQIRYALDDVRYLADLRTALLAKCDACGTRAWLEAELKTYENPAGYGDVDPQEVWKKIKSGASRLDRAALALLRALAAVREQRARELNLPRAWLGDDASLVELAAHGPVAAPLVRFRHRLKSIGQRDALAADYAAAMASASALPDELWPDLIHPHYIPEVLHAADEALAFLRKRGAEIHVDPVLIANRATLTAFVDNPDAFGNPLSEGWRHEVAGREIAERFYVP